MADALCGPSNALSNFQKHSSVDRTLQQDRLASSRSHEQGFRSGPGPNAGILDAEFEAFRAGQLPQLHEPHQEHHFHNAFPLPGSSQSFQRPQGQLPGWASEFQNMNLNDVQLSPAPVPRFRQFEPPQSSQTTGWQQDFMQQPATNHLQEGPTTYGPSPARLVFSPPGYLHALDPTVQHEEHGQQMADQAQPQDVVDDALFEQHFEAAAREASQTMGQAEAGIKPLNGETSTNAQPHGEAFDTASLLGPSIQRPLPSTEPFIDVSPQDPIGSDLILEEVESKVNGKGKQPEGSLDEGDELARTAGTLLENVQHDQSQKFKQSNFLSLMRQLRDREVRVEGDKLVDVSKPPSSPYVLSRLVRLVKKSISVLSLSQFNPTQEGVEARKMAMLIQGAG